jgi:hypothetical protein
VDPFEVVHVLHAAHDIREWWDQPHNLMGRAVRTIAGPDAFNRLPERFRTNEAAQEELLSSRAARATAARLGVYLPRVAAIVPTGAAYDYVLEAVHVNGSATVIAASEPRAAPDSDLRSYAAGFRANAKPGAGLDDGMALSRPGLVGTFTTTTDPDSYYVDNYCDVGPRRYRAIAAVPTRADETLRHDVTSQLGSLCAEQQEEPELRRARGDLRCASDGTWLISDTLRVSAPDQAASVVVTSVSTGQDDLDQVAHRHEEQLRSLPEYTELERGAAVVLGGRNGIRRLFRFRDTDGTSFGALAVYYIELDRMYCALETVSSASAWGSKLDIVMSRLVIV